MTVWSRPERRSRGDSREKTTMQSMILLFCSVFSSVILSLNAQEYSNRWTVQIDGDKHEADRLAQKHGFVNLGRVIDNHYSFQHDNVDRVSSAPSTHVHKGLMSEPNVKMVEQQELKSYNLLSSGGFYVNDPRWNDMWYINREDGQPTYNVIDVWKRNITGEGVVVAVVDEGFDPEHPDLRDNYDERASYDVVDNDTIPVPKNKLHIQYGHGEKCAGIIAAVFNNSECGVGLAFKASLGGIRLFFEGKATDAEEARALSFANDYIDIYSNSWGPGDKGFEVAGPGKLTQRALQNGAETGRGGLGSIYVFAAGNGGFIVEDSCAFNGYVNSIYTIAITGINKDDSIPGYGEQCPGIMAVTYSRNTFRDGNLLITTDTKKGCTDDFGASSAATAMASGLIALMLSANKNLSWRDVQHIIVRSSRPDPKVSSWTLNGADLRVNDYVGFGLMDASQMVDLAVNWTRVPSNVTCVIQGRRLNRPIPSQGNLEESIDLSTWSDHCNQDTINYLEHVEVSVNLTYTLRGELLIKLISPNGTVSNLTHYRMADSFFGAKDLNWVLMTLHHWGESAVGPWRLKLKNSHPEHDNTGTLFNWTLTLHGTTLNPLEKNSHVPPPATPQPTETAPESTTPPPVTTRPTEKSKCEKGFERNEAGQCVDVNECSTRNGRCSDTCVNTHGSYVCKCPKGFQKLWWNQRTCQDVNECLTRKGRCSHTCVNTPGSYVCKCPKGFQLSQNQRTCQDIDECLARNRRCSHTCVNTQGSYVCKCPKGFQLSQDQRTCQACRDRQLSCANWVRRGFCKLSFVDYMKQNCKKSCKFC